MGNMCKYRCAFSADLHLDTHNWKKHPQLCGDALDSFRQLIDFCIRHKIPLLLGGDIFDVSRPDPKVVKYFIEQTNRLYSECGEYVYFVQGDHDKRIVPWCSLAPHVVWVNETQFNIHDKQFYGLDFYPRSQVGEKLANIPKSIDFLLTHLAWSDVQPIGATNADLSMLDSDCIILSGDFHTHKLYAAEHDKFGVMKIYSPGSTNMRSWSENSVKRFFVFDTDWEPHSESLDTRRFEKIYISDEKELIHALDMEIPGFFKEADIADVNISDDLKKPAFRIRYKESIPKVYEKIKAAIADKAHIFFEPVGDEAAIIDVKQILKQNISFEDVVKEFSKGDKRLQDAAIRLLTTNEIVNEFSELGTLYANQNS